MTEYIFMSGNHLQDLCGDREFFGNMWRLRPPEYPQYEGKSVILVPAPFIPDGKSTTKPSRQLVQYVKQKWTAKGWPLPEIEAAE